jgi:hypothetical protein
MNIAKSGDTGGGGGGCRGAEIHLAQLEDFLAWPKTAASPHSTDLNGNLYFRLDT